MYIKSIAIVLEPESNEEDKKAKAISMNDDFWTLPQLYPKEIRLVSSLEAMIKEFNRDRKK